VRCWQRYSWDVAVARRHDFLDEIVDARRGRNPEFPGLAEAALRRRQLLREPAARREKLDLSQTVVAARMGTSQSAVARLEAGEIDAKFSTVERFAAALGQKVEWRLTKALRSYPRFRH
jgi:DNA-binding XRE family transcriptional regulator